jgi:hypothetical protein
VVKRGVPWRNGVWKPKIIDGPQRVEYNNLSWPRGGQINSPGQVATLSCATLMRFGNPLIGDRVDCFLMSLRLHAWAESQEEMVTGRTGYHTMWRALWAVRNTKPCPHVPTLGEDLKLEPDCLALSRYDGSHAPGDEYRLLIFLSAGNKAARWHALLTILGNKYHYRTGVLLRVDDCCFQCAVDQGLRSDGRWFLVL